MLEKAIVISNNIAIPNLGWLIFGIILALVGAIGPKVLPEGGRVWTLIFWIGIIVIIIWFILLALSLCC